MKEALRHAPLALALATLFGCSSPGEDSPERSTPPVSPHTAIVPAGWEVVDSTPSPSGWARRARDPRTGVVFILVDPGRLEMGSPEGVGADDEHPRHTVRIARPFYLSRTEVTGPQWRALMNADPTDLKGTNRPVESVSWEDAQEYCERAGYRLPTEAEWEYACRAGTATPWSTGEAIDHAQANFAGERRRTTRVASYDPNAWGFLDMHGNVWEWCQDVYDAGAYDRAAGAAPEHTSAPAADGAPRVLRGGGWQDDADALRCAKRSSAPPFHASNTIGLRVAFTPAR